MKRPITNEQILAFAAGELTGEDARRVGEHLDSDPKAARTVDLYRTTAARTVDDDSVAPPAGVVARAKAIFRPRASRATPSWPERLEMAIARLVFDSRLQPATVRFTDGGDRIQLGFETDDSEVDVQIMRLPRDEKNPSRDRFRVIGQIDAADAPPEIEVRLVPSGTETPAAATHADERALFDLEVDPGVYDLRIRLAEKVILLPSIEIK